MDREDARQILESWARCGYSNSKYWLALLDEAMKK